jgi:hypothetical protein
MYTIVVTCTTTGCRSRISVEIAGSLTSGQAVDAARGDLLTRMKSAGWVVRGDVPTCAECESAEEIDILPAPLPAPQDWRRSLDLS